MVVRAVMVGQSPAVASAVALDGSGAAGGEHFVTMAVAGVSASCQTCNNKCVLLHKNMGLSYVTPQDSPRWLRTIDNMDKYISLICGIDWN